MARMFSAFALLSIGILGLSGQARANLADAQPEVNNHAEEQPQIVERLTALHNAWAQDVSH